MTELTRRDVLALGGSLLLARARSGFTQDDVERATAWAEPRRDELSALLSELVSLPSPGSRRFTAPAAGLTTKTFRGS